MTLMISWLCNPYSSVFNPYEQSAYLIPFYHMPSPTSSVSPHSDFFLVKFVLPFVQNHFLVYKVGPNVVMNVWQNS